MFVFVNSPIRFGRAWIFPTGLNDAMWHMFKFNSYAYSVHEAKSIEEGFALKDPIGSPMVLIFDTEYHLQKAIHTTKTVEEKIHETYTLWIYWNSC